MKTLRQIISVVTRKRISKVEIFDKTLLSTEDSKFTELYNAIESDQVKTDSEAAQLIYNDPNSVNYRKLKSRFLKRLLNTLFFLDINGSNKGDDYRYNHYSCTKALMHAKLLRFFGAFESASKIIKLKYNDAKKFAFYDILAEYSWFLIQYYSLIGNVKSLQQERTNYYKYKKIADSEAQCQLIYYVSIVEFIKSSSVSQHAIDQLKQGIVDIEVEVAKHPTAINIFNQQMLKFNYYETIYDWENLLEECDKAYKELSRHKYYNKTKNHLITFKKLVACLNLKRFNEGVKLFDKSKSAYAEGSTNWFVIRRYGELLAIHSDDRELAYSIYNESNSLRVAKFMNKPTQEFWSTIRAYLHFLIQVHNEEHLVEHDAAFKKFRLYKFLNEVPIYSKDKSGNNVALLIIQYMFLLIDGDYESIIQKMDSLKVYRSRYLKEDMYKRAYTFIGMLIKVEKDSFVYKKAKKSCAKEYNLLQHHTSSDQEKNPEGTSSHWPIQESEIIPYEKLWYYILKILEYNDLADEVKARRKSIAE
ncbi:MAG: hypothetical protein R2730_14640 [Chitinophagales bacterium]